MRVLSTIFLITALNGTIQAQETTKSEPPKPDLSGYRTVDKAITTRISRASPEPKKEKQPGYLGAYVELNKEKQLSILEVASGSPAAKADLKPGDKVQKLLGKPVPSVAEFREMLQAKNAGDKVKITVLRDGKETTLEAELSALSRPMTGGSTRGARAILGIQMGSSRTGALIARITPGSGAANGGLEAGDLIVKIDDKEISAANRLRSVLSSKKPGDTVTVHYKRKDKEATTKVKLGSSGRNFGRTGWDTRRRRGGWSRPEYKLAVIPIAFDDVKPNEKITTENWEKALFSEGTYNDKSATGQRVYGSLNDYYKEISYGKFKVTGKVFDYVEVSKKHDAYSTSGARRSSLFIEALDILLKRDGDDALNDYNGIFFLYAGGRARSQRGGLFWPHRASFSYKGKRWSYFICPEGGTRMASISVIAHEFGHMLGLPDLYARRETPGSEGVGVWCTMSTGHGRSGRPLHFSAWSKEQLGWIKPAVIDPRTRQKLILSPATTSEKEFLKVLIRPDGSEYLLLENRAKNGFDIDLPGEGLLIWRVVRNRPVLQESHGVTDSTGPRRYLDSVPYPSRANNAYTPRTTPSSRRTTGDLPVHITNIQKLPDGRITFFIGYELF